MVVTLGAAVPPACATTPSGILEGAWLASPPSHSPCQLLEADSNKLEARGCAEPAWEVCAPAPLGPRLSVRSRPALPLAAVLPRCAVEPESPPPRLPALHFQNHVRFFAELPFPLLLPILSFGFHLPFNVILNVSVGDASLFLPKTFLCSLKQTKIPLPPV